MLIANANRIAAWMDPVTQLISCAQTQTHTRVQYVCAQLSVMEKNNEKEQKKREEKSAG